MSIVHQTFSAAFQHRPEVHPWGTRTNQAPAVTEARPDGASSGTTAASREGSHFEVDAGSTVADGQPKASELEVFLSSLMYGE